MALAFVPLVALSAFNSWSALRAVEGLVREAAQDREARTAQRLESVLDVQEDRLLILANSAPLRDFVRDSRSAAPGEARAAAGQAPAGETEVRRAVRERLGFFYQLNSTYYQTITILAAPGRPLDRLNAVEGGGEGEPRFQSEGDIVASDVLYDKRVWTLTKRQALRSALSHGATHGTILGTTVPVFEGAEGTGTPVGALFVEIRLKEILEDAAQSGVRAGGDPRAPAHVVVALDNETGRVVYHTAVGRMHRPVSEAMPYFEAVAARMRDGGRGTDFYYEDDGDRWLVSYRPVNGVNLSLAAAEDYTAASADVRRAGFFGVALATLAGLAAVALVLLIVRRATSRIEGVAHAASAIEGGDLDYRIEVEGNDETSRLAESFNTMSDRLRELIRRESESKQFESFMRLSAMLTHDLKNAITGLLMLVSNMEKRFDRQEFRADAITSLRDATEKLRRIVSRLSEPLRSLSGEYRLAARPTDLVPVIRRVLAAQAEPSVPLYEIEARLPEKLVATVEAERIENVIENFVINALEAMGAAGGRLTVEAGDEGDRHIFIAVSDTGVGMSEEFLKTRLFRPFSTTKTRGVGLGLFTCKEIVETHGGRLEVESKPGVGTRFRIVLPSSLFMSGERRGRTTRGVSASGQVEPGAPK